MKKLVLVAVMALMVSPVLAFPTLPDGADAYWARPHPRRSHAPEIQLNELPKKART